MESFTPQLVDEKTAAQIIGMSRSFLAKARMTGNLENHLNAPVWIKAGRSVRYAIADLESWIERNRRDGARCSLRHS